MSRLTLELTHGDGASDVQHRLAQRLGVAGGALGVLAGTVQATIGNSLAGWSGNKLAPTQLGLLTIILSLIACAAATRQRSSELGLGRRTASAFALLFTALICFSTVGRLWYLPGPLLLVAGVLSMGSVAETAALVAKNWLRCLLGALGAAELLMSAGAAPPTAVVGVIGGLSLLSAAWLPTSIGSVAGLTILGCVPFAVLAWTAVFPIVLLLAASAISIALAWPHCMTSRRGTTRPG